MCVFKLYSQNECQIVVVVFVLDARPHNIHIVHIALWHYQIVIDMNKYETNLRIDNSATISAIDETDRNVKLWAYTAYLMCVCVFVCVNV